MDGSFILLLFLIGFLGSFISGMVGIGGAIVNYPMLLYIPPLLGFAAFTAHQVSGISAVQVFFTTIAGVLVYRTTGYLNKTVIMYMGISVLLGSFLGGYGSHLLPEHAINFIYGILAVAAVVLMFFSKKGNDMTNNPLQFNKGLAAGLAFIVGICAGIVGAGGSFLMVPIMLAILKIPVRVTIASSLAITFISSIGVAFGKIYTGQVSYLPAMIVAIASLLASPLGAQLGRRMNTKILQRILAVLIAAVAIKVWSDIIYSFM